MCALKIVVYPCSTFLSVFSSFSALCEKEVCTVNPWRMGHIPPGCSKESTGKAGMGTFSSSLRAVQVFMPKAKVQQLPGSSCWGSYWSWASPNFSFVSSSIFWSQWLFQWQAIQAQEWKCCLLISSFLDYRSPTFQSFGDTDLHVLLLRIGSGLSVALSACQALEQGRRWPKSVQFDLNLKVFCSEHGSAG